MTEQDGNGEIARRSQVIPPSDQGQVGRKLRLGTQEELDLTSLNTRQQDELEVKYTEKAIERDDRRQRLKDDLTATAAQLGIYTKAVADATAQNAAVTIS